MFDLYETFLRMLPMAVSRSSLGGGEIRYVLPVLWMTSYLHINDHNERRYVHIVAAS